jgi:magnesium chelatase family protein
MIAKVTTAALSALDAIPVIVEVDLVNGLPKFDMVGLPDKAVEESKERVRSAVINSGLDFPMKKLLINLAPADVRKSSTALDLPIAIAILVAAGQIPQAAVDNCVLMGELGLDGKLRPIDGAISVAILSSELGIEKFVLPAENAKEASFAPGVDVIGVENLEQVASYFNGGIEIEPTVPSFADHLEFEYPIDFADIKGQAHAIRALEIAASGSHNVLMVGPPGSGKTMLARRLPTILPPLTLTESVEVTRIYSVSGIPTGAEGLIRERPFRAPHHSASHASIIGGGKFPKPGEVSLSHNGVLFLDEMPEFQSATLEALRQPLEDLEVTVARVQGTVTFPASCIMVGAMNPCPCGFRGYPEQKCISSPTICTRYASKISGPLMDRIDLHIEVGRLKPEELVRAPDGEQSSRIRERVQRARDIQEARLGQGKTNGKMGPREIKQTVQLDDEALNFMKNVAAKMSVSGRVYDRILKVGRTIADLDGADQVGTKHLAEAVQYRDRQSG